MPTRYAAFVRSVDRARREIRVEVPPFTNGATLFPLAQIEYPIGDDSMDTEIRIVVDKPVWVAFEAGDPRYPIITGFRNPNVGNEVGWRRWNHDNIEWNADAVANVNADTINLMAGTTVNITAGTSINLKVGDSTLVITGDAITGKAGIIKLN